MFRSSDASVYARVLVVIKLNPNTNPEKLRTTEGGFDRINMGRIFHNLLGIFAYVIG